MLALFLTTEQLCDLTGLRQPAAQVRWLQRNGIEHYVWADGKPRVPLRFLTETLPAQGAGGSQISVGPDFASLTS